MGAVMTAQMERWLEALTKLIQKTQENEIQWQPLIEPASVGLGPGRLFTVYETTYRGQRIVVYHDEGSRVDSYGLRFVARDGSLIWQSPDLDALRDLFAAIEYRSAGIEDLIEALIKD